MNKNEKRWWLDEQADESHWPRFYKMVVWLSLVGLLLVVLFSGCHYPENTQQAVNWLNAHPKPIICIESGRSGDGSAMWWVFIDRNGELCETGPTSIGQLPDTIKTMP